MLDLSAIFYCPVVLFYQHFIRTAKIAENDQYFPQSGTSSWQHIMISYEDKTMPLELK